MQIENLWVSCLRCTRCDCQHVTEFPAQPKTACRVAACTPQGFQSHGTIPSRLTPRNPGFVTPRERSPPGPPTRHQRHRLIRRSCSGRARSPTPTARRPARRGRNDSSPAPPPLGLRKRGELLAAADKEGGRHYRSTPRHLIEDSRPQRKRKKREE